MHLPIWLRILLVVNLVVLAAAGVIGAFASDIAGRVVEEGLIRRTAERTGRFLRGQNLPFSDTLMGYLHRMHGVHFVTVRLRDGALLGTSLPVEARESLGPVFRGRAESGSLMLPEGPGRFDSHTFEVPAEAPGGAAERLRLYVIVPQGQFEDARATAAGRILRVTVPVVLVASAGALILGFTLARPIRRLARRMERLSAAGRPADGEATPRRGPAEVVRLGEAFDRLMDRLGEARNQLARQERLATLGRVAAGVVHELRNPLSGIRMNLRVLQEELTGRGIEDPGIGAGLREVERMALYLDELTDLAAGTGDPDAGAAAPLGTLEVVSIEELVESVLALFEGRRRHAGVELRRQYDPAAAPGRIDAGRVRQVLINLVANALDAMPGGGTLTVRLKPADGRVRCEIADTGPGVPPEAGETLFEPFVSTKRSGVGLGLYVCRRIVTAHGGEIGFRTAPDGAVFWFELPGPAANESHHA